MYSPSFCAHLLDPVFQVCRCVAFKGFQLYRGKVQSRLNSVAYFLISNCTSYCRSVLIITSMQTCVKQNTDNKCMQDIKFRQHLWEATYATPKLKHSLFDICSFEHYTNHTTSLMCYEAWDQKPMQWYLALVGPSQLLWICWFSFVHSRDRICLFKRIDKLE